MEVVRRFIPRTNDGSERQSTSFESQAVVRVLICAFMGVYYAPFDFSTHPLYIFFATYCVILLTYARRRPHAPPVLLVGCVFFDNAFSILGLHETGRVGTLLLFFLILISFGYGIRFGFRYLVYSLTLTCSGIVWLCSYSAPWQGDIHFFIGFLLGTPFISLYIYYLTSRLRAAERNTERRSHELREFTSFLVHDIRTPLGAIVGSVEALLALAMPPPQRKHLERINSSVELLAEFISNALPEVYNDTAEIPDITRNNVSVAEWVVTRAEAFRDVIRGEDAELSIFVTPSAVEYVATHQRNLERVLLNALSNASRFCSYGRVKVEIGEINLQKGNQTIRITNALGLNDSTVRKPSNDANQGSRFKKFSGGSLGMRSAIKVARQMGGDYQFSQSSPSTFITDIDFTCSNISTGASPKFSSPVICICDPMSNVGLRLRFFKTEGPVYVWHSAAHISPYVEKNRNVRLTVFLDSSLAASESNAQLELSQEKNPLVRYAWLDAEIGRPVLEISDRGSRISMPGEALDLSSWARILHISHGDDPSRASENSSEFISFNNLKVLLVDDDESTVTLYQEAFRMRGAKVSAVRCVEDVLCVLSESVFDLIVTDWFIGSCDMEQALTNACKCLINNGSKVLVLSGDVRHCRDSEVLRRLGASILSKPVSLGRLEHVVADLFANRQPRGRQAPHCGMSSAPVFDPISLSELISAGTPKNLVHHIVDEFARDTENNMLGWFDSSLPRRMRNRSCHKLIGSCESIGAFALAQFARNASTQEEENGVDAGLEIRIRAEAEWNLLKAHLGAFTVAIEYI